jgi:hypothetical protein
MTGPREEAVRAALLSRPAAVLYSDDDDLLQKVARCFAGLHNGALQGHLNPGGGLFVGKAECEWDWQQVWPRMVQLGLVEFRLTPRANHPQHASHAFTALFEWRVTEYGQRVQEDDLRYFDELVDAMTADRKESAQ